MRQIIVTGNTGKDPERITVSGKDSFVTISLAANYGTKEHQKTDWYDVSFDGQKADLVEKYVRKGMRIMVKGAPGVSAYINKEGKPVGVMRIYADTIEFMEKKDEAIENEFSTNEAVS